MQKINNAKFKYVGAGLVPALKKYCKRRRGGPPKRPVYKDISKKC